MTFESCLMSLQGIRTGRLPIGAHMQLATSKVLTVNQVCQRNDDSGPVSAMRPICRNTA